MIGVLLATSTLHAQAHTTRPPTVPDTAHGTFDLELVNGDHWQAEVLEAGPEAWRVRATPGIEWQVPVAAIRSFGYPENERLVWASPESAPDKATRGGDEGTTADPGQRTTVQLQTPPFLGEGRIHFWWLAGGAGTEPIRLTLWLADRSGSSPAGAAPQSLRWILPCEGGSVLPEPGSGVDFARTIVPVEPGWHRFTWHARTGHVRVTVDDRVVAERTGELPRVGACRWEWSGGGPTWSIRGIQIVRYQEPSSSVTTDPDRDERQDAVLLHDGSTLYGRLGRLGAQAVRLVPFAGKDVPGEGEKLQWGEVRRVWRSGAAPPFPTTPWGKVGVLEWTGRDAAGGATRHRWRVVTPTTNRAIHGRESPAWHHPLLGRLALPPESVVNATAEFEGALTWLGAPDSSFFGRTGPASASWDVPFSLPATEQTDPKATGGTATFLCEVRGLERSTPDDTPLPNPLTGVSPDLPLLGQRPLTLKLGAGVYPGQSNPPGLRLSVNGVTVGRLAELLPVGAKRTHFSVVRIPIPQSALRASDNRLAVEFVRADGSALDLPQAGVPQATQPARHRPRDPDIPVELRRAMLEWQR